MIKVLFRLGVLLLVACTAMGVAIVQPQPRPVAAASPAFAFEWLGKPSAPQPWAPGAVNDWDLVVHDRDVVAANPFPTATAQHGADCSPAPATHTVSSAVNSVFICNNHMMTTLNAPGYGEIEMAPARLADWSQGTTSITFSVSTFRTSARDWFDLYVMPFQENVLLPGDLDVDLLGRPRDAIHMDMGIAYPTTFAGELISNFVRNDITTGGTSVEDALRARSQSTSAVNRTRLELDISRTHIRFGMPDYNNWWVDRDVAPLSFNQGVVQLGHHSYTPDKECSPTPGVLSCTGNTWHWSDFSISSAVPFTMLRPGTPWDLSHSSDRVEFKLPAPAPANSFLRMAAIGHVRFSADGGRTWMTPQVQPTDRNPSGTYQDAVFNSYWTPFPAGATSIMFTGEDWFGGWWSVNDPSIWSGTGTNTPPAPPPGNAPPIQAVQPPSPPVSQSQAGEDNGSHEVSKPSRSGESERHQPGPVELVAGRLRNPAYYLPAAGVLVLIFAGLVLVLRRSGLLRLFARKPPPSGGGG
jgi:hypothetical protein